MSLEFGTISPNHSAGKVSLNSATEQLVTGVLVLVTSIACIVYVLNAGIVAILQRPSNNSVLNRLEPREISLKISGILEKFMVIHRK